RREHPLLPRVDEADEGVDRVARRERRHRLERAEQLDVGPGEADLLLRLAQVLARVLTAAGERDLARVPAHVAGPAGQDRVEVPVVEVEVDEDRGVGAAVDVEAHRLLGIEQNGAERAGEVLARAQEGARARRSTRSSNMTSPSSVRCTGHFAAMI